MAGVRGTSFGRISSETRSVRISGCFRDLQLWLASVKLRPLTHVVCEEEPRSRLAFASDDWTTYCSLCFIVSLPRSSTLRPFYPKGDRQRALARTPVLSIREPAGHSLKIVLVVVLVLGLYLPKKTEDENEHEYEPFHRTWRRSAA